MTPEELTRAYWELYEKVFSPGNIVSRTILNQSIFRHPGRQLFYLLANLYYRHQIKRRIAPNIF
jgi:hypothetical protein